VKSWSSLPRWKNWNWKSNALAQGSGDEQQELDVSTSSARCIASPSLSVSVAWVHNSGLYIFCMSVCPQKDICLSDVEHICAGWYILYRDSDHDAPCSRCQSLLRLFASLCSWRLGRINDLLKEGIKILNN